MRDNQLLAAEAAEISGHYAAIYRHCHRPYATALSHQAVRVLQYAAESGATVQALSRQIGAAGNTTSEIIRRLAEKGLVTKARRVADERVVEVRATPAGLAALAEHTGLDTERLAQRLVLLPASQLATIRAGLGLLLDCLRPEDAGC